MTHKACFLHAFSFLLECIIITATAEYYRYVSYEQCQPFDSTQTTLNTTTNSQPDDRLAQQLQERASEVQTLQKQLSESQENSQSELERVILDYEQKIDALTVAGGGQTDSQKSLKLLTQEKNDLERKLSSAQSKLDTFEETISSLESEKAKLQTAVASHEQDILTYQGELEQIIANHEEEIERNEQLQQQMEYAASTIRDLQVSGQSRLTCSF